MEADVDIDLHGDAAAGMWVLELIAWYASIPEVTMPMYVSTSVHHDSNRILQSNQIVFVRQGV